MVSLASSVDRQSMAKKFTGLGAPNIKPSMPNNNNNNSPGKGGGGDGMGSNASVSSNTVGSHSVDSQQISAVGGVAGKSIFISIL